MKKLSNKEEEIMEMIWQLGPCSPKDVQAAMEEPAPHINTIATSFQILEKKGYLTHKAEGRGYVYFPAVNKEEYRKGRLGSLVDRLFGKSYLSVVSTLVAEEKVTEEELMGLLEELKKNKKRSQDTNLKDSKDK